MPDAMGVTIRVPADLGEAGPAITLISANIGDELSQLASLLAPLHDYWQGVANESWQTLQQQWNQAATDLIGGPASVLAAIGSTTSVNWDNYVECEAANVRTWAH